MRGDYQPLVDEISSALEAPATLEDRDFGLIAFGAHDTGDDDTSLMDPVRTRSILQRRSTAAVRAWFEAFGIARATGPLRIPPDPSAGVIRGRICLPARHGGVVQGYVWVLDDGHLADVELGGPGVPADPRIAQAMETATRIGALLAAEVRSGAETGALLRDLVTGPATGRTAAQAGLRAALGPAADGPLALVAVAPWDEGGDGEALSAPSAPGVVAACAVRPAGAGAGHASALAALVRLRTAGAPEPAVKAALRLLESPRAAGGAARPGAGIGDVRVGVADLAAAWHEALAAARAGRADPALGPVLRWADAGPYRLLTWLPAAASPDPAVRVLLAPAHAELARTVEVFLDCAGQAGRAASELAIHRQTLYYRLRRVTELTGLDLDSGEDRLLLHMALKAARL
ncbi:helix-turn-helix domain-containing protein [Streptomyces sp. NPDC051940]|uniref:helix-turn-helix domain-containing protein n=1 Tax=Streptomyces sp. NPDC051940 TaxID=3155675 RepID=UPI00344A55B6